MDKVLNGLNDKQIEAVLATEGRVRVLAGAGSGKTRTLTHRYAYIVNTLGIDPSNILCVTFTNKAAKEMIQRIAQLVPAGNYNDFVCTFHGFCVKFLRREIYRLGYPATFTILDEEDTKTIAREVLEDSKQDRSVKTINKFLQEMAVWKKVLFRKKSASVSYIKPYLLPGFLMVEKEDNNFVQYLKKQSRLFALDFDDLIYFTLYILYNYTEARDYWQQELNYIMVDEAQDCSENEWLLVETLCEYYKNLFVVGDPDQLIYEWRGVLPDHFIQFQCDKDIVLSQNYRSSKSILNVANTIIANNQNRIKKDLFTNRDEGPKVIHFHGKNDLEESNWIVKQIKEMRKKDPSINYSDYAILYRTSSLSRNIEEAFIRNHFNYTIWGGVRFFDRKEIKDMLSYLRLVATGDDLSFMRVANVPSRKIGKVYLQRLQTLANGENCTLYETLKKHKEDKVFHQKSVDDFIDVIEKCKSNASKWTISDLLTYILINTGYQDELRKDSDEDRLENLKELINSIQYYETSHKEDSVTLISYLQDIALYTNADYKKNTDSIKLMTIHQAKGLEFSYVFVVGLTEGIMPSYRSIRERKKSAEEEERRLAYVAFTRAEKALFLTESEGYNGAYQCDKYPSRFIREIKKSALVTEGDFDDDLWHGTDSMMQMLDDEPEKDDENLFEEGAKVHHEIFGDGIVKSINITKQCCRVLFDIGERNISFRVLTKISQDYR